MEELDMDEEAAAATPEFACPYCYEDHDVASLCAHLEEEHPFEPHSAVSALPLRHLPEIWMIRERRWELL